MNTLKEQGKYRMAMALESNDNRTPVLCLLKSNALSLTDKKEYFPDQFKDIKYIVINVLIKKLKTEILKKYINNMRIINN